MLGLKRVIHYWSWISMKLLGMAVGASVLFGILLGFMDGGLQEFISSTDMYLLLFGVYFGLVAQVTAAQTYLNLSLSMGAGRRHTVIGLQYINVILAVGMFLADFLFRKITGGIYSEWGVAGKELVIMYIGAILIMDGIGMLLATLISCLGKLGMIIFVGIAMISGGVAGFFFEVMMISRNPE